jgi:DNA repair photolyase
MGTWRKVPVETPEGVREGIAPLVLSASRATDIPAFYLKWFLERLDAGYVRWRNPFGGAEQFVSLREVRACVFWTKNPAPLLSAAERLEARFPFVVQVTVNDYEAEGLEPGIPPLAERLGTFVRLSRRIGRERVIWRFDPLLLGGGLSAERLLAKVEAVGEALASATEQLVFSFADVAEYRKVRAALDRARLPFRAPTEDEMHRLAEGIGALCRKWGLRGATCAERIDLEAYGIGHNRCIDGDLLRRIAPHDPVLCRFLRGTTAAGAPETARQTLQFSAACAPEEPVPGAAPAPNRGKDRGQRAACRCIASKDIGAYGTCPAGCVYCYATASPEAARARLRALAPGQDCLGG